MWGLLPGACWVCLALGLYRNGGSRRRALVEAHVIWGVLLVVGTEALSVFHAITFAGIAGFWVAASAGAAWWAIRDAPGRRALCRRAAARELRRGMTVMAHPLLAAVAIIVVMTGFLGLLSAPCNYDSMTYHLARVMHWAQNHSVQHYASNFHPQLYHGPWAEFAMLHLQLLAGSDRYAFAVQWISMVSCILIAANIARRLGADGFRQAAAGVFVVTLPTGILQAPSTQNSYVVALWLLIFLDSALAFRQSKGQQWLRHALLCGGAAGLAVLTKGTAYLFLAPFAVWLLWLAWRRSGPIAGKAATVALICVILLNGGYYLRNLRTFGDPLLPRNEATAFRNDQMSVALWASNVARHAALQLWIPGGKAAAFYESSLCSLYQKAGADISDSRITCPGHAFRLPNYLRHEDLSGSPLHFAMAFAAGAILLIAFFPRRARACATCGENGSATVLALTACSFGLFCAGVKWMEYNTRLMLPLFVLCAAPASMTIVDLLGRRMSVCLGWLLILCAIPYVVGNPNHALFGRYGIFRQSREEQYFANNPALLRPYQQAADFVTQRGCTANIGFAAENGYEYPLWILIHNRTGAWPRITDIAAAPIASGTGAPRAASLDAAVVVGAEMLPPLREQFAGFDERHFGNVAVFVRTLKRTGSGGRAPRIAGADVSFRLGMPTNASLVRALRPRLSRRTESREALTRCPANRIR